MLLQFQLCPGFCPRLPHIPPLRPVKCKKRPKSAFTYSSGITCGHACPGATWKSPLFHFIHALPPTGHRKMPLTFCSTSGTQRLSVGFVSLISSSPSRFAERCTFAALLIIREKKNTFSTRKVFKTKGWLLVFYVHIVCAQSFSVLSVVTIRHRLSEVFEQFNFL